LRCTQSNVGLCGHVTCLREYHMISLLSLPKQRIKLINIGILYVMNSGVY